MIVWNIVCLYVGKKQNAVKFRRNNGREGATSAPSPLTLRPRGSQSLQWL